MGKDMKSVKDMVEGSGEGTEPLVGAVREGGGVGVW